MKIFDKKEDQIDLGAQNIDNYELPNGQPVVEKEPEPEVVIDVEKISSKDDELLKLKFYNPAQGMMEYEVNYAIQKFVDAKDRESEIKELAYRLACLYGESNDECKAVIDSVRNLLS